MTLEHITITEEVVKDGKVVTESRETVQYTPDTTEASGTNLAYGLNHPGFVSAQDRIYTYNEETGMSESKPADVVEPVEPESDVEELLEDEEVTEEELEEEAKEESETDALCHHPVGNGECQLPADHEGQHKLNVD